MSKVRIPARRNDWKTEPMPEQCETFVLNRSFSEEEMEALRRGSIPQAMEDKWFWYMEGSTLWAHRSWTGYCVYRIDFKEDNHHIVTVNRNPEQYGCTDVEEDIESLNNLLDWWVRTPYDHYSEWISETYDTLKKVIPPADAELLDAIKARHSVRRYLDKQIETLKVAAIRSAVESINTASGLNIQLVLDEPKAFSSKITTYGQFSGVGNYFVLAAPKGKEWKEKVGYYGEQLVLLAQTLGLNTCWVGLTYKKIPEAYTLRDGDIIHCVIALGYGENQGRQHPLKPIEKFYESSAGDVPQWFIAGVEAALLAPTAVNQQKFKFILHPNNIVEAKALFSMMGYTKIDLGIAKCHFEIGAGKERFAWK